MITIGLCGWGDHAKLYEGLNAARRNKLPGYAAWFAAVEVDSTFYAVQKPELMRRWAEETPAAFRFVVKAYQGMTGHTRGGGLGSFESEEAMYGAFLESVRPMREADKLYAALFQYPPWFDCTREHVNLLRRTKERMGETRCALEFRHQSWYAGEMREKTLEFARREGWIHTVCDEPQAGPGSVPIVEAATDRQLTVVRLHGRNTDGWVSAGQPNWRDVRYLYRYNAAELEDWAERLRRLERQSDTVCVLFNNNSGGDAADNALELMDLLGQKPPRGSFGSSSGEEAALQLDMFDMPDEW